MERRPHLHHREIDIEFAKWGDAGAARNAQYVVQPYNGAGNLFSFAQPGEATTAHQFTWASNRVSFGVLVLAEVRRHDGWTQRAMAVVLALLAAAVAAVLVRR